MKSRYCLSVIAILGLFASGCQDPRHTPPVNQVSYSAQTQMSYAMPNITLERAIASTGSHGHH